MESDKKITSKSLVLLDYLKSFGCNVITTTDSDIRREVGIKSSLTIKKSLSALLEYGYIVSFARDRGDKTRIVLNGDNSVFTNEVNLIGRINELEDKVRLSNERLNKCAKCIKSLEERLKVLEGI